MKKNTIKELPKKDFKEFSNKTKVKAKIPDFLDQNNSANYLNANCPIFTIFDKEKLSLASIWILERFEKCQQEVNISIEKLEISVVIETLYRFLWDEFAAWYLEYLKTDNSDLEFGKVIFEKYIVILSPFAPFVSQFLWENFFGKTDLLANLNLENLENLENWENSQTSNSTDKIENNLHKKIPKNSKNSLITLPKIEDKDLVKIEEFEKIISFVTKIRSLRGLFGIDFGTLITILTDNHSLFQFAKFAKHLAKVEIEDVNSKLKLETNLQTKLHNNSSKLEFKKVEIDSPIEVDTKFVPKNDLFEIKIGQKEPIIAKIDLISYIVEPQKQLEKAQKELENLSKQIETLQRQLQNPDFIQKAESEIIEQKRKDLLERQVDLTFQTQKINFLKPLLTQN